MDLTNENRLTIVEEYAFTELDNHKMDYIIDNCITDCYNKCLHTFTYRIKYDNKITKIRNIEIFKLTNSDNEMNLYGLNKILKTPEENVFLFNQLNKLKLISFSSPAKINFCSYSKF